MMHLFSIWPVYYVVVSYGLRGNCALESPIFDFPIFRSGRPSRSLPHFLPAPD